MTHKTYVSVCKNQILSNLKHGTNKPVIRVSRGKYGKPERVHSFQKYGLIRILYANSKINDLKPMPWGARVWIEIE